MMEIGKVMDALNLRIHTTGVEKKFSNFCVDKSDPRHLSRTLLARKRPLKI
jgi:hypothetical protein